MAESADNQIADSGKQARRWFGARGDAAQGALGLALEMALKRLDGYLEQMFDRIDDVLFDRAEKAANAEIHNQYFDALRNIRLVRPNVRADFSALIIRAFEQGCPRDAEIPTELRLHSTDDTTDNHYSAEEELAFTGLVRKIRTNCTDSLRPLERRLGFLLEDPDLENCNNPLGPQSLCDAFRKAAEQIEGDLVVRLVIFKVFDQKVAARLRGLYREIDHALLQLDVLPGIKSRRAEAKDARAIPMARGIEPSRSAALVASATEVSMAPGIVPGVGVDRLESGEAERGMAPGIEADSSSAAPDNLAETVPMAPGIVPSGLAKTPYPDAASVPMAAGIVPSGHSLRPVAASEPVVTGSAAQPVMPEQTAPPVSVPEAAVTESDRVQVAPSRKKMETGKNRLQAAVDAADAAIRGGVKKAIEPEFVRRFIAGHWKDLLKLICMREGKDSNAWKQALTTMNDLVWSVNSEADDEQRERLRLVRPRLIGSLREGMQRLSLAVEKVDGFIDELEQLYSSLLGEETECLEKIQLPVLDEDVSEQAECLESIQPLVLDEETPEEIAAAAHVLSSRKMEFASETRPGTGLKNWQNGDRYTQLASNLEPGGWVEFSDSKGKLTRAKLSWNSPITNTLLFTDKQGLQAGNYTLEEFAGMLRLSRARILKGSSANTRSVKSHR